MNIIFDLGGVVFAWHPDTVLESVFPEPEIRARAAEALMRHPDWVELDRGTLDREEAVCRASDRSGIPREKIRECLHRATRSLVPMDSTLELIRLLEAKGHRLYVLSNMHHDSADFLESAFPVWKPFRGIVFSCREHLVKPEEAIYRLLLERYGLAPGETLFIDDTPVNLKTAEKLGIRTHRFRNARDCRRELEERGIL